MFNEKINFNSDFLCQHLEVNLVSLDQVVLLKHRGMRNLVQLCDFPVLGFWQLLACRITGGPPFWSSHVNFHICSEAYPATLKAFFHHPLERSDFTFWILWVFFFKSLLTLSYLTSYDVLLTIVLNIQHQFNTKLDIVRFYCMMWYFYEFSWII